MQKHINSEINEDCQFDGLFINKEQRKEKNSSLDVAPYEPVTMSALVRFKSDQLNDGMTDQNTQAMQDMDSISLTLEEYEKHFVPNLPEELIHESHIRLHDDSNDSSTNNEPSCDTTKMAELIPIPIETNLVKQH